MEEKFSDNGKLVKIPYWIRFEDGGDFLDLPEYMKIIRFQ